MSIIVQAWVYANSEARLADRLVLLAIADEADDDGTNAFPSLRRIAHKARVAVGTASAAVLRLEETGALVVTRPEKTGRGHHNRYTVVLGNVSNPEPLPEAETRGPEPDVSVSETRGNARPKGDTDPLTQGQDLSGPNGPKPRARFLEFDALVYAFGEPGTKEEAKFYAKVARSLKDQGKHPGEISDRGMRARARHPECTVNVLLTRWSNFAPRGPAPGATLDDVARRDAGRARTA